MNPKYSLIIQKTLITVVLTACYALMPMTGYNAPVPGDSPPGLSPLITHVLYIFCHANLWHLAGNLFVIWLMTRPLYLLEAIPIAVICSFLPVWSLWPVGTTVGCSGVIFAMWGVKWGLYCRRTPFRGQAFSAFLTRVLPFAFVGIVIPNVNWCLHLYCLLTAFLLAFICCRAQRPS